MELKNILRPHTDVYRLIDPELAPHIEVGAAALQAADVTMEVAAQTGDSNRKIGTTARAYGANQVSMNPNPGTRQERRDAATDLTHEAIDRIAAGAVIVRFRKAGRQAIDLTGWWSEVRAARDAAAGGDDPDL